MLVHPFSDFLQVVERAVLEASGIDGRQVRVIWFEGGLDLGRGHRQEVPMFRMCCLKARRSAPLGSASQACPGRAMCDGLMV